MPVTPFHFGPGALIKAISPRGFSWAVFVLANCLVDIEPVTLVVVTGDPAHPWLHTLPGAIAVAVVAATMGRKSCEAVLGFWNRQLDARQARWLGVQTSISATTAWISALVGTLSHLALDSVMHADVAALWPFSDDNLVRGLVSLDVLHWSCVVSGLLAIPIWLVRRGTKHD